MGKSKRQLAPPAEDVLPLTSIASPTSLPIFDTHCHILSTFSSYRLKYPGGAHETLAQFIQRVYACGGDGGSEVEGDKGKARGTVEGLVDVWCEAPIENWQEVVESAQGGWGGVKYHFVIGVHPHNAKDYTDDIEKQIEAAASHPANVGIGECGLDYHYDHSDRAVQAAVFARQLRLAVRLGKPVTVHTREADEDCWRILTAELPKDHRIHVHCFTDEPAFAAKLLDHFPNLYIGVTGVVTFTSNNNTRAVVADMVNKDPEKPLRILLETDSPYMIPSTLPISDLGLKSGQKLPLSHAGMIPWTAEYVAEVARRAGGDWTADRVMLDARRAAKAVYGV